MNTSEEVMGRTGTIKLKLDIGKIKVLLADNSEMKSQSALDGVTLSLEYQVHSWWVFLNPTLWVAIQVFSVVGTVLICHLHPFF